jgi:hypothetical protein
VTRGASQRPVTYDDDDRQRDILRARPARTGARNRLLLPREGVLDFCSRCTFSRGESRGHVDSSSRVRLFARRSVRRQVGMPRETRQLLPLYRCTNTCTRARKKGGSRVEDHPLPRTSVLGKPNGNVRISDYGNSSYPFVTSLQLHACTNTA